MEDEERLVPVGAKRKADLSGEPSALRKKWCYMYNLLKVCGEKTGTCNVPLSYKVEDNGKVHNVGTWLGTQRQNLRKKQLGTFECAQLQLLADKGWLTWGTAVANASKAEHDDQQWERMYQLLLCYQARTGHCNVPEKYEMFEPSNSANDEDCPRAPCETTHNASSSNAEKKPLLGRWLERQRSLLRAQTLRADRAAKLQTLVAAGLLRVDAQAEEEARWQAHYSALLRYANQHGHCNVPYYYVTLPDGELQAGQQAAGADEGAAESGGSDSDASCASSSPHNGVAATAHSTADAADAGASHAIISAAAGAEDEGSDSSDDDMCDTSATPDTTTAAVTEDKRVLKLGAWLNNQRHARHGQRNKLRVDRRALLQALVDKGQLKWTAGLLTRQQKWDEMYAALLKHCQSRRSWLSKPVTTSSSNEAPAGEVAVVATTVVVSDKESTEHATSGGTASSESAAITTSGRTSTGIASTVAPTTTSTTLAEPAVVDRAVAVVPTAAVQLHAQLLPFPGSTELSDGTTQAYFPWLQRQLHLLQRAEGGTLQVATTTGTAGAGVAASGGKAVVGRDRLTAEQVAKLQVLLEKGVTVLRWAAAT